MAKYRIESVTIEGFKAFTEPKSIDISGNIVFLFGKNGNGKSSIIEAIRWCLSGGEREETLRNTFYEGDCCVEVKLKSADSPLTIHRRLRQGLGKSDVKVYTSDNKDVNITELFPYMSKLGGEGVYILSASQVQPPGRQRADITEFGPVIYEYLGLTEITEIIATIKEILELCEADRVKLDAQAEELKHKLQDQLREVDKSIESLVTAPPWEGTVPPTKDVTCQKIKNFVSELAAKLEQPVAQEGQPEQLLTISEKAIEKIKSKDPQGLKPKAENIRKHVMSLTQMKQEFQRLNGLLQECANRILNLEQKLSEVSKGETIQEIEDRRNQLKEEVARKALRAEVLRTGQKYVEKEGDEVICPLCGTEGQDILSTIKYNLGQETQENRALVEKLHETEVKFSQMHDLSTALESEKRQKSKLMENIENLKSILYQDFGISEKADLDTQVENALSSLKNQLDEMERAINDVNSWIEEKLREKRRLGEELRFHELRRKQERLQYWLEDGLEMVQKPLSQIDQFLASVTEIGDKFSQVLDDKLEEIIPPLSKELTRIYQGLTEQISFEQVSIVKHSTDGENVMKAPELLIKVGTQRRPLKLWDPDKVLNGQALKAIQLAPYFVFSNLQAQVLELDLLMLDDPSQHFDIDRIKLLLKELQNASTHAQVIIASQEPERFQPHLNQYFTPEQRLMMNVRMDDPIEGPFLG